VFARSKVAKLKILLYSVAGSGQNGAINTLLLLLVAEQNSDNSDHERGGGWEMRAGCGGRSAI